jgi:hypothetical protein
MPAVMSAAHTQSLFNLHQEATVTYSKSSELPPVISTGFITLLVAHKFAANLKRHWANCGITKEGKKLKKIPYSFKCIRLENWWRNKLIFMAANYAVNKFFMDFQKCFLEDDLEDKLIHNEIKFKMPDNMSFKGYFHQALHLNLILPTTKRLTKPQIQESICSNWSALFETFWRDLGKTERARIDAIVDFDNWTQELVDIDNCGCDRHLASANAVSVAAAKFLNSSAKPVPHVPLFASTSINTVGSSLSNLASIYQSPHVLPAPSQGYYQSNHPYNNGPMLHGCGFNAHGCGHGGSHGFALYQSNARMPPVNGIMPPGMTVEQEIIIWNNRCLYCCQFYMDHRQHWCPNPAPNGGPEYVEQTQAMADAIRVEMERCGMPIPEYEPTQKQAYTSNLSFATGSNSVAAAGSGLKYMYQTAVPLSLFQQTPLTSGLQEVPKPTASGPQMPQAGSSNGIAAVFAACHNFIVKPGENSKSDNEEESNPKSHLVVTSPVRKLTGNCCICHSHGAELEVCPPLLIPHLLFPAFVLQDGLRTSSFDCLLDNSAHFVLISRNVVKNCKLQIRKLKTPKPITQAITLYTKQQILLTDYVHLDLSSLNGAWTLHTVHAVISDDLCYPILLGQPFLKHNKLVIDHDLRSAVDKNTGFDILNNDPYQDSVLCHDKPSIGQPQASCLTCQDIYDEHRDRLENASIHFLSLCPKTQCTAQFTDVTTQTINVIGALKDTIVNLEVRQHCNLKEEELKDNYHDVFHQIPHANFLPDTVTCQICLKDEYKKVEKCQYSCPRAYCDTFQQLINDRLKSGFIRPLSSRFASLSFCIPKKDPTAWPHWVCDYRQLNKNTVPDNYTLPHVDDILADCGKRRIWAVFDMINTFFQTKMHPNDVEKTAVSTPFGTYEWLVMPMGFHNAPPIHQQRVSTALAHLIGKICHVYMDDIIIWSDNMEEHVKNIIMVMDALQKAKLYLNAKKTKLFCDKVKFLGHKISIQGIQADDSKIECILEWPCPKMVTDV